MKFFWSLGCSDKAAVLAGESVPVRFVDFLETGAGSLGRDGATVESSAELTSKELNQLPRSGPVSWCSASAQWDEAFYQDFMRVFQLAADFHEILHSAARLSLKAKTDLLSNASPTIEKLSQTDQIPAAEIPARPANLDRPAGCAFHEPEQYCSHLKSRCHPRDFYTFWDQKISKWTPQKILDLKPATNKLRTTRLHVDRMECDWETSIEKCISWAPTTMPSTRWEILTTFVS